MTEQRIEIDPYGELVIHLGNDPISTLTCHTDSGSDDDIPHADFSNEICTRVIRPSTVPAFESNRPRLVLGQKDASGDHALQMRVSLKHVKLACHRARAVFGGKFSESQPEEDGLLHWRLRVGFDRESFVRVMNIVHGYTKDVPVEISVGMLAAVAAVVDDLQCHDAIWFIAKAWIRKLKKKLSEESTDNLSERILIALVFSEPDVFLISTRMAILHGTEAISSEDLPIYSKIIGMGNDGTVQTLLILKQRIEAMEAARLLHFSRLMTHLQEIQERLSGSMHHCTVGCSSMLLGSLIQELHSAELLPEPPRPFVGRDIFSTMKRVRSFRSQAIYEPANQEHDEVDAIWRRELRSPLNSSRKKKTKGVNSLWSDGEQLSSPVSQLTLPWCLKEHECTLASLLEPGLSGIEAGIIGLSLSDYVKSSVCDT